MGTEWNWAFKVTCLEKYLLKKSTFSFLKTHPTVQMQANTDDLKSWGLGLFSY